MTDVVHVYKDFPPVFGGIENHIATLGRALVARGLGVDVLCSRHAGLAAVEEISTASRSSAAAAC